MLGAASHAARSASDRMPAMRSKAALTCTLLATLYVAEANAQESKTKPQPSQTSASEHLERAGQEIDAAGRKAAEEAKRAAADAKREAREAARDTGEQVDLAAERVMQAAKEAKQAAKQAADEAGDTAREAARGTSEAARELLENGKEQTRAALDEAREGTRELLLKAADALSPEARARARAERKLRWAELRVRLPGHPNDPEKVSIPVRTELGHHARRVARLERVRAVALENQDHESATQVATLLDKENARHERRMAQLASQEAKP